MRLALNDCLLVHFTSFKFRVQILRTAGQASVEISSLIIAHYFNCSACLCCCRRRRRFCAHLTFPKRNPRSSSRKIMRNMQRRNNATSSSSSSSSLSDSSSVSREAGERRVSYKLGTRTPQRVATTRCRMENGATYFNCWSVPGTGNKSRFETDSGWEQQGWEGDQCIVALREADLPHVIKASLSLQQCDSDGNDDDDWNRR